MENLDSSDSFTDYNLLAAYYRDIGNHIFLTAEEELQHSKIIQQGFAEIVEMVCKNSGKIEQLQELKTKIEHWKKQDKSFKPKQQILNEIRRDIAELSRTQPLESNIRELEREIEIRCQRINTARNIMVKANLPLVIASAKRYKQARLSLNDLVQEGNMGLMRAVLRFDFSKGFRFATYASWWIKQSIAKAIVDKGKEIRVPYHFNELSNRFFRKFCEQKEELGRTPTLHELSRTTNIPMNKIRLIIESANEPISLETPAGDDGGTLAQFIENEKAESPYQQTLINERFNKLHNCLSVLTERQRDVVSLRFGLKGRGKCTLQEIGEKFQVTRECIRQTEVRALRRLRMSQYADEIREYCVS